MAEATLEKNLEEKEHEEHEKPKNVEELLQKADKREDSTKEPNHEEKLTGGLEEILTAGKNLAVTAAGAATPFMYYWNKDMMRNAAINAWPLQAGTMLDDIMAKKPVDYKKAAKEGFVGTIMTPPLEAIFKNIEIVRQYVTNNAGAVPGGAAAVSALAFGQALFVGTYMSLNHLVQNLTFKGLYEKLKKDYWPAMKRTWKYVLPVSSLNVLYLYQFGIPVQLAYSSLMTLLMRVVGPKTEGASFGNLAKAMNPVHYISGGLTAAKKLATNLVYAPFEALYKVGSGLGGKMYESAKPTPSPSPHQ